MAIPVPPKHIYEFGPFRLDPSGPLLLRSGELVQLPLKTLDDRYLDVYIESKIGDFAIVHDGGRSTAELFAQGIHLTDAKEAQLKAVAARYGASYADGSFSVGCRLESVQQAVLAVAQCASLAMYDVLTHAPVIEAEPLALVVRRTLERWKPTDVELRHRLHLKTETPGADHVFDSVAFPRVSGRRTVAVKTLAPGYGPQVQADRYGFLVLDIRPTDYNKWPRLAVVSKADQWPSDALKLVRSLSAKTLEVRTGDDDSISHMLPAFMDELAA